MNLGPHAFFIIAAYVVTAVIVAGLVLNGLLDSRAQRRALAELKARGLRRRSDVADAMLAYSHEAVEGEAATTHTACRTI
jgi:heme exporter protein D